MKKFSILLSGLVLIALLGFTRSQGRKYPVVVHFNSICCGVPDRKPLEDSIHMFLRKQKIKTMKAYRVGPLGKEGEYDLVFDLKDLKKSKRASFIALLERVSLTLTDRGASNAERDVLIDRQANNSRVQWTRIIFK